MKKIGGILLLVFGAVFCQDAIILHLALNEYEDRRGELLEKMGEAKSKAEQIEPIVAGAKNLCESVDLICPDDLKSYLGEALTGIGDLRAIVGDVNEFDDNKSTWWQIIYAIYGLAVVLIVAGAAITFRE